MLILTISSISHHFLIAVTHSWKAFYTASTGLNEFPEFVALNLLDDEVMGYFDSRTNRFESKQSWMTENLGQQYVEQETNTLRGVSQSFKVNVGIAMERFNQSKGRVLSDNATHTQIYFPFYINTDNAEVTEMSLMNKLIRHLITD